MSGFRKKILLSLLILFFSVRMCFARIIPNDPGYFYQWYLKKIKAPEAWSVTTGSKDIIIAVLDSGVDIEHPDLKDNIWNNQDEIKGDNIDNDHNGYIDDVQGWDFVGQDNDPHPDFDKSCLNKDGSVKEKCIMNINHGTMVSGILAARGNNKQGVAGVTWQTKIMPLRVVDGTGHGEIRKKVVAAINYAVANHADIINLSLVGDDYSKELEAALQNAYDAGVIIVAAAGNNEGGGINIDKKPKYPICYKGKNNENIILGVVGTDQDDNLAEFSNYGTECVDISAPAVDFFSTSVFNPYYPGFESYYSGLWSGTSLATPLVSGLSALLKATKPELTNKEIYELIINNTDKVGNKYLGSGRINVAKALGISINAEDEKADNINYILTAPSQGKMSEVRIFQTDGVFSNSFLAYNREYLNGVNIANGDINEDGYEEIITAKSFNDSPEVRTFYLLGNLRSKFLAYDAKFKGGVVVASGDTDGDGKDDIITGAGKNGSPQVRVFDGQGNIKSQFFAYKVNFRGGITLSAGNIDKDKKWEIITGAGAGGRAHVRVFDNNGNIKSQFFAYPPDFMGGINVTSGDMDGDGIDEIITGPLSHGGPQVRIFNAHGEIKKQFFAFEESYHGGINIQSGDLNNDGKDEILVAKRKNGGAEIKIFDGNGILKDSFYAFEKGFAGGINIGILKDN